MRRENKERTRRICLQDALKILVIMLFIIGITVGAELLIENLTVVQDLRINYETEAMGVSTTEAPVFSWNMSSKVRGQSQKSYEIRVYEGETGQGIPVWTSGVVKSGESAHIKAVGLKLEKEKCYSWRVLIQPGWGWKITSGVEKFVTETDFSDAEWIIPAQESDKVSLLRRAAGISRMTVKEAYLYISSMGNYRAYVEGVEVTGPEGRGLVLSPGWTNYNTSVNYQTYDVTDLFSGNLFDTTATIGIELSDGWYASDYGENAGYAAAFGPDDSATELGVIAKLVLRYANGKTQVMATESRDWYSSGYTDVRFPGIYSMGTNPAADEAESEESTDSQTGEVTRLMIDGNVTRELDGWLEDKYEMPVNKWSGVDVGIYRGVLVSSSGSSARISREYERSPVSAYTYVDLENETAEEAGNSYGSVVKQEIDLKKKKEIRLNPGEKLILDYGTYASGQVDLEVSGVSGTELYLTYARSLNDGFTAIDSADGTGGAAGSIAAAGAANYLYILSGDGEERYFPSETYETYRYVEISANQNVTIHSAIGRVFTSAGRRLGRIETSSSELNRLYDEIIQNQIAGRVSIPNSSVGSGERDGKLSFAQICTVENLYNLDSYAFYLNFNEILQLNAAVTDGSYGMTGPVSTAESTGNSPGSSDAGILIPWQLYQQTGDLTILEEHFNEMVMYMNRIFTESYSNPLPGDPMAIRGTSGNCMGEIFRLYCTLIMQLVSDLTGRPDHASVYEERFGQLKEDFMNKYLDEEGNILSSTADGVAAYEDGTPVIDNSQTVLLWALKLSLYRTDFQKDNMLANLVSNIKNPGRSLRPDYPENSLDVGLFGINIALPVLSDNGNSDLAYRILLQEEYPSWIYTSSSEGRESHIGGNAADSVAEWMYRYMAGITQDAYEPGFRRIILQPEADTTGTVTEMNASYDSPAGTIKSGWETAHGKMRTYTCEVPANTTARLYLPISMNQASSMKKPKGAEYSGMENHNGQMCASYELVSGSYKFRIPSE